MAKKKKSSSDNRYQILTKIILTLSLILLGYALGAPSFRRGREKIVRRSKSFVKESVRDLIEDEPRSRREFTSQDERRLDDILR